MNIRKLMTGAVATAMAAPVASLAAIDDQGMQYVSAGEGLRGSFRIDLFIDTDEEDEDVSSSTDSLRLYLSGDIDLGGGMKSTYYYETRDSGGGSLETNAYDIGLTGPFGSFAFGDLAMVAPRMAPGADLAASRGVSREHFAADTKPHGIRYESPVINGFQFGASGILNGSKSTGSVGDDNPDGSLDEFSIAVKYTLPVGLQLGAGFESKDVVEVTTAMVPAISFAGGATPVQITAEATVVINTNVATIEFGDNSITQTSDSLTGFRFGARYGQDNWLVGYEYRGYDGFNAGIAPAVGNITLSSADSASSTYTATNAMGARTVNDMLNTAFSQGFETNEYVVHAVGAQAKVDRFTMSAGYSMEENTFTDQIEVTRDNIAIDAAYSLGSKSTVVLGWKRQDREATLGNYKVSDDTATTFLWYRVDF